MNRSSNSVLTRPLSYICHILSLHVAVFFTMVLALPQFAKGQQSLLDRMPTPAKVLATVKGAGPYKSAARQYSALLQLRGIAKTIAELEGKGKADKQLLLLIKNYEDAMDDLDLNITKVRPVGKPFAWGSDRLKLQYDENFRKELYQLFLSKSIGERVNKYEADAFRKSQLAEKTKEREELKKMDDMVGAALIALFIGLYLLALLFIYFIKKNIRNNKKLIFLDEHDPTILRAGNKVCRIQYYTGVVIDAKSIISETVTKRVTVYEDNHRNVSYSSTYQNHEKFHLQCYDGQERAVHLINTGIQVRNGAIISGAYAIHPNGFADHEFLYYNHQLDKQTLMSLNGIFTNGGSGAFLLLLILTIICAAKFYMAKFALYVSPSMLWLYIFESLQLLVAAFATIIIPISLHSGNSGQKSLFITKGVPRIIELFKKTSFVE